VGETCQQPGKECDPAVAKTAEDGQTYTTVVTALTIAGGVTMATAGLLWIVSLPPSKDDPAKNGPAKAKLGVGPTATGLRLLGTF